MKTGLPVVAFVGRPNVGKSTLFNRVVGDARAAIVEDRARTTRDRMYGDAEWNGRRFVVVDTGGLEVAPGDPIEEQVQLQARLAMSEADVIVFLVDAETGPMPADADAADLLRRTTKPVLVAANKADNEKRELSAAEFYSFGWEDTFAISANHGRGVADLLDAVVWALPPESDAEIARKAREEEAEAWAREMARARPAPYVVGAAENPEDDEEGDEDDGVEAGSAEDVSARWDAAMAAADDEPPAIAFVGRPNVGKSSLLNALVGEERTIVSDIPGTTRDAIDTTIAVGPVRDRPHRHRGHPTAGQGRVGAGRREVLHDAGAQGDLPGGRRGPGPGCARRADGAGRARRRLRDRGGQGPHHRGQQVGHRRGQDAQELRRPGRHPPPRAQVHRLRADRVHQRQDRPARPEGPGAGRGRVGRAPQARSPPAS